MGVFEKRKKELRTPRLLLRVMDERDEKEICAIFTDPSVGKTYMLPDFENGEQVRALFGRFRVLSASDDHFIYAVTFDGNAIGFVNETCAKDGEVELGWVIASGYRNRGFASEAADACIEELFRIGFDVVRAGYFEGNDASRRVMEKCGMTPTGKTERVFYRGETHLCPTYEKRKEA